MRHPDDKGEARLCTCAHLSSGRVPVSEAPEPLQDTRRPPTSEALSGPLDGLYVPRHPIPSRCIDALLAQGRPSVSRRSLSIGNGILTNEATRLSVLEAPSCILGAL